MVILHVNNSLICLWSLLFKTFLVVFTLQSLSQSIMTCIPSCGSWPSLAFLAFISSSTAALMSCCLWSLTISCCLLSILHWRLCLDTILAWYDDNFVILLNNLVNQYQVESLICILAEQVVSRKTDFWCKFIYYSSIIINHIIMLTLSMTNR